MNKLKTIITAIFVLFISSSNTVLAQVKTEANKNDLMYRDGRINVVVAVLAVVLCGLFFYVWKLDRKITKLEKNND